jgi:hypothetical protein
MRLLALLLIFLNAEVVFALDRGSFIFGEAPFGESDRDWIKLEKRSGRIIACESRGAIVFSLRDGTEYGFDVGQIRVYDRKTKKLYAVYSDDIERTPDDSMRGIEARYGKIKYISNSKVQFEVFWKDKMDGYGLVDLDTIQFTYHKVKPNKY